MTRDPDQRMPEWTQGGKQMRAHNIVNIYGAHVQAVVFALLQKRQPEEVAPCN